VIVAELSRFSIELAAKTRLLVATKVESPAAEERAAALERETGERVWRISAAQRKGLKELLVAAHRQVRAETVP
jgi:GTPase involved in cell partitioning and DNA repair